jgi:hypothetical protein
MQTFSAPNSLGGHNVIKLGTSGDGRVSCGLSQNFGAGKGDQFIGLKFFASRSAAIRWAAKTWPWIAQEVA